MAELVQQGKVRYLGCPKRLPTILGVCRSPDYRLWSRDPEDELLPTVRELGIGYVAYSPLGRDFSQGSSPAQKISPKMTIAEIHPDFRARISTRICNWSNR